MIDLSVPCDMTLGYLDKSTGYKRVSQGIGKGYKQPKPERAWRYAHIVRYEQVHGAIPARFQVDHLCRNRACSEPLHLEAVSQAENIRRQLIAGKHDPRWLAHSLGTCTRGHPATEFCRVKGRMIYCRACRRERRAAGVH